ncbi:helix-turn-helix domain-containing protein [Paenibacillus apiarius]|uniref:Helix-turn-helix domain-containing protein n=1 Tax=Paenibacillus apiarius TaxID=46240 RepID=A0ABT4DZN8_9BACL|nr:helix-turn-helix domain-containing protein [Paenibacillus apiarius]MCY9517855.1 helix-turn-helix domain-containing protein [Paenibacillus apiarius]MCY9522680.1 helix-turn-helix domain-containing protein [Paenibacillus apiarius]MCY9555365.1 helix-turn-helix domain-containing protein [Paenibacillus apiarius]MCY9561245.1 helix-turn-helix domain-containing protein [Paenibacillus apiarius]MCY9686562.1 helix-turn-helix domain-containing protein [Paenibacillus apiarius]
MDSQPLAMEDELFDLVVKAQSGDDEAVYQIIAAFLPVIRSARSRIKADRRDDLEQSIVETLIRKIVSYDLTHAPDFSAFCRQLHESQDTGNYKQF